MGGGGPSGNFGQIWAGGGGGGTFMIAIPEPSTWAMMIAGFAGLGFAGYRASRGRNYRRWAV